ncbi:Amino acid ABC transporter permease [Paraburkholderia unamae]|uniref:amino acid ABC transporter permease n=1 Tax=Paraburkholderia unamae TaxID=219649 RepID=UPI001CAF07B3|nr:amino acid ABC transporter permease [Paraburkholderia unamae]CAG9243381.1 Amino acid ABC transporter permease [Paraburkholderia unamae]
MDATESTLTSDRARSWHAMNRLRVHRGRGMLALAVGVFAFALVAFTAYHVTRVAVSAGWPPVAVMAGAALACGIAFALGCKALQGVLLSARAQRADDIYAARTCGAQASDASWQSFAYSAALVGACAFAWLLVANDAAVSRTFFDVGLIVRSSKAILLAFVTNLEIFAVSAVCILVWALAIAIARTLPGRAGKPIRTLAIAYCDLFRGLPVIINIYLIGFGLPLTDLPVLRDLSSNTYAILALTLTYGAYTAEIYRAGIESVHPSQIAAARSLGLSYLKTLRFVTVPLAVRGIVPPLLNNMISLQKDTALVAIIGTIDAFNQSKIIASNNFNLSAVTTVAIVFVLVTIPQARFVDRLIERDRRRMRAGL